MFEASQMKSVENCSFVCKHFRTISHFQIAPVSLISLNVTMANVNLQALSVITLMIVETTVMRRDVVSS